MLRVQTCPAALRDFQSQGKTICFFMEMENETKLRCNYYLLIVFSGAKVGNDIEGNKLEWEMGDREVSRGESENRRMGDGRWENRRWECSLSCLSCLSLSRAACRWQLVEGRIGDGRMGEWGNGRMGEWENRRIGE